MTNFSFYSHWPDSVAAEAIEIRDNTQLTFINLTNIENAETIDISGNGPAATVLMSNLLGSYNVSLSNVASVDLLALTGLEFGNLNLSNNTFETFLAPNLTSVGSIYVTDNAQLRVLNLSSLYAVQSGDLIVTDNPLLGVIIMDKLEWTHGKVVLTGNLST